jgi:hypothetical protein
MEVVDNSTSKTVKSWPVLNLNSNKLLRNGEDFLFNN